MADQIPPDGRNNRAGGPRGRRGARPSAKPGKKRPHTGKSRFGKASPKPSKGAGGRPLPPGPFALPTAAPRAPQVAVRPAVTPESPPALRQAYAAIDLGTNNCRLLIARPCDDGFVVIDAFSRVVRLGEGLAQSGRLSPAAMDRAVGALRICADKLRKRNVHLARSVATEACRQAENGAEFIARVRAETGIALDIISAEEEARLAVLGCHILLEDGPGPAVIFDIGGGSTELVLIEPDKAARRGIVAGPPRILDWQSVPWGVVSLSETVGEEGTDPIDRIARYARMKALVHDSFRPFAERLAPHRASDLRLLGTSGTVTTLASLHLDLPQYDRRAVDGLIVPAEAMRMISARLSAMGPEERRQLSCIGHERADLVVAGCAILETILDIWPAARLGVADRGIREGILRSLMTTDLAGARNASAFGRKIP
ncbi:Ppx/GppA phosphatase family protein [Alteraurantiacibacter palmitatis]|uniref:Ppx/GppA phosphatase family protein n=1 Tax=Alteraurantiacibacter palmitatis TaxID=2054628 RepID=A0ABV7E8N1_9SPHN